MRTVPCYNDVHVRFEYPETYAQTRNLPLTLVNAVHILVPHRALYLIRPQHISRIYLSQPSRKHRLQASS